MNARQDFTASIELLLTERCGRRRPTPSDFLACVIETEDGNFDCRLWLEGSPLSPGDCRTLGIGLLDATTALKVLKPGTRFYLRSGERIGSGYVLTRPELRSGG